jgi:hypothetical protein
MGIRNSPPLCKSIRSVEMLLALKLDIATDFLEVCKPKDADLNCKVFACWWQAMPLQRVVNAVLSQDAVGCGLFVVGHDCTLAKTKPATKSKFIRPPVFTIKWNRLG